VYCMVTDHGIITGVQRADVGSEVPWIGSSVDRKMNSVTMVGC